MDLTAAALGALTGLVLAFTGAGGGILAIPLLVLGLHLPVQQAGPVGLAAVGMASALGALVGLKGGIVRYRAASLIGATGMLAAPLGVAIAQLVPSRPLTAAFGATMAWVAWRMLRPGVQADRNLGVSDLACMTDKVQGRLIWTSRCARALAGTGALSGLMSGLLGVGGGFVIVPALGRHTNLDIRSAQATSLAVIALVSVSGVAAAVSHGAVNWSVGIPFASGATLALLLGQQLALKTHPEHLRRAFAWVAMLVAGLMLARALDMT